MSTRFDHVSIDKHANIYADGKCISFNLTFPDGSKKTIGVILPACIPFASDSAETMEIVAGTCRVRFGSDGQWTSYEAGQRFHVPAQTRFELETREPMHYVCHFDSVSRPPMS
jgi:uncharacterized protein YaiE (UPF0345 family)